MDNIPTPEKNPTVSQEQMLMEIYANTRKTKNYMKWQLIITVAFVILPLLAMGFVLPFALKSLGSAYNIGGLVP